MSPALETADVLIVGFGPTGATLANLLGREGVSTRVIERASGVYTLPRAVHFDHEVMRIFQSIGLAERILPYTGPVSRYDFQNAAGEVILSFDLQDATTSQGWRPDYMFHQPSLERVLREGAARYESVQVHLGRELVTLDEDADGVRATIRDAEDGSERTIRARYVVGCDGASSPTRQLAGLGTEDLEFDEPWLVVDATAKRPIEELDFPEGALQHCDPERPTTVISVVGPYLRWEFMLLPGEGTEMREPGRVRELVSTWVDPDDIEVIRSAVYRFHALVGTTWRTQRTLVAGDAAHQMPPFLGQGMCAGIRDVDNLAWKLTRVLDGSAGEALLDSYQEERAPHVRTVIQTAVELGGLICTRDPEVARARDAQLLAGGGVSGGPPALPGLVGGALEKAGEHPLVGQLGLQARVRDASGRGGLLDDLVGPGFTLLEPDGSVRLDAEARVLAERLGVREVRFSPQGTTPAEGLFEDAEGAYAAWFDQHAVRAVLVRPDHAVFGVAPEGRDPASLLRSLAAVLG